MHGNLEPEDRVMDDNHDKDLKDPLDEWRDGKVYPVITSTTQLLGDLSKAFYESGWSPHHTFEVQQAGTWKKDRFIVIKNRSIEQK